MKRRSRFQKMDFEKKISKMNFSSKFITGRPHTTFDPLVGLGFVLISRVSRDTGGRRVGRDRKEERKGARGERINKWRQEGGKIKKNKNLRFLFGFGILKQKEGKNAKCVQNRKMTEKHVFYSDLSLEKPL